MHTQERKPLALMKTTVRGELLACEKQGPKIRGVWQTECEEARDFKG